MVYKLELIIFTACVVMFSVFVRSLKIRKKEDKDNKLYGSFITLCRLFLIYLVGLTAQIIYLNLGGDAKFAIYFDYIVYLGAMYQPILFFNISKQFENNDANLKKYRWMYYLSTILLVLLWTNDLHHLFYKQYSIYFSETVFGPALMVYSVFAYVMYVYSMIKIVKCSRNKSGMLTMQSLLIILGILVPLLGNFIGIMGIANTTIYLQAILFSITILCYYIAIVKLKALNVIPVAIKTIMDTMTDSFIVISKDGTIADINKTCIEKFAPLMELKQNDNLYEKLAGRKTVKLSDVKYIVEEATKKKETITKEYHIEKGDYNRYFEVDVQPIKAKSGNEYIASLLLIRDITQAKRDMEIMTKNENLVILGELAGGVAHDINTPIAAIKNGIMMLKDTVLTENEKMLLARMDSCADKIINLVNSMRNQIRNIGSDEKTEVNITSVINDTLMIVHNETMKKGVKINLNIKDELKVMGNTTKLGQVITNLVMNAIQAYENNPGIIDIDVYKSEKNEAVIIVEDYAGGIPEHIRPHIFKNILTTKGVSGTGFGLYLAYSVIKGAFGGDMHFETETGKGTKFVISIPM